MSANYASGLSEYKNKGTCGSKEIFDGDHKLFKKAIQLAKWISESKHCVVYCGAGLSTSAGIPDFRGPNGIWTLEKYGIKVDESKYKSFADCIPTFSHMAIIKMLQKGLIKYVISQNIDGLFLKANIERDQISELHGNYFIDKCNGCKVRVIRNRPSTTMGCRANGDKCPFCQDNLHDTILDWDQQLPDEEIDPAEKQSDCCDLAICLGTSLQIQPANQLPLRVLKAEQNNKLVIVNLQRTKFDHHATMVIHHYIDKVMRIICQQLSIDVDPYQPELDPTKSQYDKIRWMKKKVVNQ